MSRLVKSREIGRAEVKIRTLDSFGPDAHVLTVRIPGPKNQTTEVAWWSLSTNQIPEVIDLLMDYLNTLADVG